MRMRKVTESKKPLSLEELAGSFLAMKKAQKLGQETLYDYEKQIERFLRSSHNSLDYAILEQDTLNFFAAIPDTSPAKYNKPYQYITAWFNWMVKQKYLPQNPISANELKKRRDDGNIKPATVEDLKRFMDSLDKRSYTDMRTYTILLVMLDCGIRTKELLNLRENDFDAAEGTLRVSKAVAKTRRERLLYLSPQTVKAISDFMGIIADPTFSLRGSVFGLPVLLYTKEIEQSSQSISDNFKLQISLLRTSSSAAIVMKA